MDAISMAKAVGHDEETRQLGARPSAVAGPGPVLLL